MRTVARGLGLGNVAFAVAALLTLVNACSKPKEATPRSAASASAASALPTASAPASALVEPSASPPTKPTGSVEPSASYQASLTGDNCPVALRINDVPLLQIEAGSQKSAGEIIDLWIHAGINSVTLEARGQHANGCTSVTAVAEWKSVV